MTKKHAFLRRVAVPPLVAADFVLGVATAASAHVTVSSSSTAAGADATLTFSVPNESDEGAATNQLEVDLPPTFTEVLTESVPGWRAKTYTTKLATPLTDDDGNKITSAVTKVVWTATGGGIPVDQFATFSLAVGPLPEQGTLYLPAVQSYSDGSKVNWVQQAQGDAEPEHPAPSVVIAASASAPSSGTADSTAGAGSAGSSGQGLGIGLGIAGIVLALVAGALGGLALGRSRR